MKALFSKQALTFVLAMTFSLMGLNGVHAIVLKSQNGTVGNEQTTGPVTASFKPAKEGTPAFLPPTLPAPSRTLVPHVARCN
jgi:hypothetical protein